MRTSQPSFHGSRRPARQRSDEGFEIDRRKRTLNSFCQVLRLDRSRVSPGA
ncbi:MAG: hypothetical protein ACK56I_17115 [bacterium]